MISVFTDTFDQFIAKLLNKSINSFIYLCENVISFLEYNHNYCMEM